MTKIKKPISEILEVKEDENLKYVQFFAAWTKVDGFASWDCLGPVQLWVRDGDNEDGIPVYSLEVEKTPQHSVRSQMNVMLFQYAHPYSSFKTLFEANDLRFTTRDQRMINQIVEELDAQILKPNVIQVRTALGKLFYGQIFFMDKKYLIDEISSACAEAAEAMKVTKSPRTNTQWAERMLNNAVFVLEHWHL